MAPDRDRLGERNALRDCLLSLCLIVRDEAAMLPGFLASVAGIWDELVAADTGSRDGTPGMIRAAGGRIVDFPWRDDFAAARNASLETARGRWILCLDADERMDAELVAAVRRLVAGDRQAGAATLVMRNALPGGARHEARLLRCFRNVPEIRFRHRIHEDVSDDVAGFLARERLALRHLPGGVDHLGYVRETAAARQKKERDLRLLRMALADEPDDLYCRFKILELARFWDDRDLWAAEAEAARSAFESAPPALLAAGAWSGDCAAMIAQALPGGPSAALAWLESQAARIRPGAAWHLRRGMLLESVGRLTDAEAAYRACLHRIEARDGMGASVPLTRPLMGLCRLAARRNDAAAAGELARRAAASAPGDPEALLASVSFLPKAAAETFAAAHVRAHPDAAEPLAQALLAAGRAETALAVLDRYGGPQGPLGVVVLALALGVDREVVIEGDPAAAERPLRSWLEALWASRRAELIDGFLGRSGPLAEAFPWVTAWLDERADAVSPSRR